MDLFQLFSYIMLFILILSFIKIRYGACLFVLYMIVVPAMNLNIAGFQIGENYINTIFLFSLIYHKNINGFQYNYGPIKFIIIYFIFCLMFLPFSDNVYGFESLDRWRRNAMMNIFFPLVIYNIITEDTKSIVYFRNIVLLAIFLTIGYGYVQVMLDGLNPYQVTLMTLEGIDPYEMNKYYAAEGEGRLFGHMSSVFRHPMSFGLFIGLSVLYLFCVRKEMNKYVFYFLFVISCVMAILCGVRSTIGGLMFSILYIILKQANKKIIINSICYIFIILIIISFIPDVSDYVGSIFSSGEKSAVRGSSLSSRWVQFVGAFNEFIRNPFFGLGYSWTDI